jgi:anti-sigma regulatory factor (Ser/Thr protein kinase)
MGDALPLLDGVALAVAHLPGGVNGSRAVGAWYDVALTDDGHVTIVMGDARGAPAGVSEQLRRAVAGVGLERRSAAATLEELDNAAREIPGSVGSTALCVTLGPSGVVRWSRAGYAPPMAVGPDGARYLHGAPGDPLGRPDRPSFAQDEEMLAAGTTLVVGSSSPAGLSGTVVDGLDPFATAVAQHHGLSPDALAAALTEQASSAFPAGHGRTLLLARVMPAPLGQCLPADPRRLAAVRRTVAVWGAQAALSEDTTSDLQLLLSEAATNAVEHAYRDTEAGEFVYSVRRRPDAGIRVTVEDFGRWQPPPDDPGYRGRGLAVIHNLANEVSLDFSDHGTRIAFTVPGQVPSLDDHPLAGVTQGWTPPGGCGGDGSR